VTITRTVQISIPTMGATPSTLAIPRMLDSALIYRSWNLSVIPACVPIIGGVGCYQHGIDCGGPGKKPLVISAEFHQRLPTENEIRHWWSVWPNANIAIITGSVSRNLVVVDADDSAAIRMLYRLCGSIDDSGRGINPSIPVVRTQRGGRHAYFFGSNFPGIRTDVAIRGFHIDIRAEGVYIMAPPSIGPTGTRYEWLTYPRNGEFPVLPTPLLEFLVG